MRAFAVVSDPTPTEDDAAYMAPSADVLHALATVESEADAAVSQMKVEVFNTLYKIGSLSEKMVDRWLQYRRSIRVKPVNVVDA